MAIKRGLWNVSFQFVKFANIEEDTPSYHRRYDFFVSQFSAMCHSTHEDAETRTRYGHMHVFQVPLPAISRHAN